MPFRTSVRSCLLLVLLINSGSGTELLGEPRCWHKLTLSLAGPQAAETDTAPNPFLDYRMTTTFRHASSGDEFSVPGYFAADGNAGESGATSGNVWRAHFAPHRPGEWQYEIQFVRGAGVAVNRASAGEKLADLDGLRGAFTVKPTNKTGRDFRAHGRLQYVGQRYLHFAETGQPFLKAGADSPETLLAYQDFDGTTTRNKPLKSWAPHLQDWRAGDPTWRGDKGKGLIGAVNYLAAKGLNAFSFLPYNAGGDGDNVWPMIAADKKRHYDCSKLDQWQIVFDHAQANGLFLHFKLQETENDDNRYPSGNEQVEREVVDALDGGQLGPERKLYLREIVARFGYLLALNWNLGEENTQSVEEQQAMARYLRAIDPYDHHVVLHTYPPEQEQRYTPHLGDATTLTGVSLQNAWHRAHEQTRKWIAASSAAGHPWVACNDEQGPAQSGVPCDPKYLQQTNQSASNKADYTLDDIRKQTLWGTLMAGGAGVEYYMGWSNQTENDLLCENLRSRDRAWDDCRVALEFFAENQLPLVDMHSSDELVTVAHGEPQIKNGESAYCLAQPGEVYLVYLLGGGAARLDLSGFESEFTVAWFNPRVGGPLEPGSISTITGGATTELGRAPSQEDWLIVVRKK